MSDNNSRVDGRTAVGRRKRSQTRLKIIEAAFDIFGDKQGLLAPIEDIVAKAGVTRATFYNHFSGMAELRDAVAVEASHDFLQSVIHALEKIPDHRERCAAPIRWYLRRAQEKPRWGWSVLNVSFPGEIFGGETHTQAGITIREGVEAGVLQISSVNLGHDILLGSSMAAMASILSGEMPEDYPETVAAHILEALGVPREEADRIARLPLPELVETDE